MGLAHGDLAAAFRSVADMERCRREIASIEALIRAGHKELEGLCLALSDWCAELRLIEEKIALEREISVRVETPATAEAGRAEGQGSDCYLVIE